jgi:hypothetical protein
MQARCGQIAQIDLDGWAKMVSIQGKQLGSPAQRVSWTSQHSDKNLTGSAQMETTISTKGKEAQTLNQ